MSSKRGLPLDLPRQWAKEFWEERVDDYDYDLLKEFVFDKMIDAGEPTGKDWELYAERIGEVCEAMTKIKLIVKFNDER